MHLLIIKLHKLLKIQVLVAIDTSIVDISIGACQIIKIINTKNIEHANTSKITFQLQLLNQ